MTTRLVTIASALFLVSTPARADEPTLVEKKGVASLWVAGNITDGRIQLGLADVLEVGVRIEGDKDFKVNPPQSITRSAGWKVVKASTPQRVPLGTKRETWQWTVTLEPLLTGQLPLQIEPITWHGEGVTHSVNWQATPVTVNSVIVNGSRKDLRDRVGIEELSKDETGLSRFWIAGGAIVMLLGTTGAWFWWKGRRQRIGVGRTPEDIACRDIERILNMNLAEKGHVSRFHALLGNVVRRYLETTLHLPARRQTTIEFLRQLQDVQAADPARAAFLREFLERCDLAKFAGAASSPVECRRLADRAQRWIREPVPGSGQSGG